VVRDQGLSVTAAAYDLNVSVRSATLFLVYISDTGDEYHYEPAMWNRNRDNLTDDPQLREAVLLTVEEQPEQFLDEMADAVSEIAAQVDEAVVVSPATVRRVLTCNGYTHKVCERAVTTRKEANRVAWVAPQSQIPLDCRVYVYEAHLVGRAAQRRWTWSLRGARDDLYVASSAGVRPSFFVAGQRSSAGLAQYTTPYGANRR